MEHASLPHPIKGRVVLTHGRSIQTLAAAQNLARNGLEIIGCDDTPFMALSFSRFVTQTFLHSNPEKDEMAFIRSLESELKKHYPGDSIPYVLMPVHRHTRLIAKYRNRFESFMKVAAPPLEAIDKVYPKHKLIHTAREYNAPIPKTAIIENLSELQASAEETGFPLFLKVPDSSGGRGLKKVDCLPELIRAYQVIEQKYKIGKERPFLVQECIEGADYCFTGLFDRGELKANMVYQNLQTFPSEGGFGVLRETVEAAPLIEISKRFMKQLGWHGVVQIDYRWDGKNEGRAYMIEINPRFWGGLFQSIESGIDYPCLLYRLTVEGHLDIEQSPIIGTRTKVPVLEALSAMQDSLSDDTVFDKLQETWRASRKEIGQGNVTAALQALYDGIKEQIWDDSPIERFRIMIEEGKGANREFLQTEDPFVILGVLYVLGSLMRHGKPPDEFIR